MKVWISEKVQGFNGSGTIGSGDRVKGCERAPVFK